MGYFESYLGQTEPLNCQEEKSTVILGVVVVMDPIEKLEVGPDA